MNKLVFGKAEKPAQFIARTGILLALTIVCQWLTGLAKIQLLTGSVVNMFLFFASVSVGLLGGVVIGVCTPLIAFFLGLAGNIVLVPFIAVANAIMVVTNALLIKLFSVDYSDGLKNGKSDIFAVLSYAAAAVLKFLFMYFICLGLLLPLVLPKVGDPVKVAFGITQLFTALIGGTAAFVLSGVFGKTKI